MHILITGGSGFVGRALVSACVKAGHTITNIDTHTPQSTLESGEHVVTCDLIFEELPKHEFRRADAVIHLAGVNVFGRWTEAYKQAIYDSRVISAQRIYEVCKELSPDERPNTFVSASAVGIYGDTGEQKVTEDSLNGGDFLARVVVDWEQAAHAFTSIGMRSAVVRSSHVLGDGGLLTQLARPIRLCVGGWFGSGMQWMPWIMRDDLVHLYLTAATDANWPSVCNAASAYPVRQKTLAKKVAYYGGGCAWLSLPVWGIRLLLKDFADVLTTSQYVITKYDRVNELIKHHDIDHALSHIYT